MKTAMITVMTSCE